MFPYLVVNYILKILIVFVVKWIFRIFSTEVFIGSGLTRSLTQDVKGKSDYKLLYYSSNTKISSTNKVRFLLTLHYHFQSYIFVDHEVIYIVICLTVTKQQLLITSIITNSTKLLNCTAQVRKLSCSPHVHLLPCSALPTTTVTSEVFFSSWGIWWKSLLLLRHYD